MSCRGLGVSLFIATEQWPRCPHTLHQPLTQVAINKHYQWSENCFWGHTNPFQPDSHPEPSKCKLWKCRKWPSIEHCLLLSIWLSWNLMKKVNPAHQPLTVSPLYSSSLLHHPQGCLVHKHQPHMAIWSMTSLNWDMVWCKTILDFEDLIPQSEKWVHYQLYMDYILIWCVVLLQMTSHSIFYSLECCY